MCKQERLLCRSLYFITCQDISDCSIQSLFVADRPAAVGLHAIGIPAEGDIGSDSIVPKTIERTQRRLTAPMTF